MRMERTMRCDEKLEMLKISKSCLSSSSSESATSSLLGSDPIGHISANHTKDLV